MRSKFLLFLSLICVFGLSSGSVSAQTAERTVLTTEESAAVSRLIESVTTKEGDALRQDVVSVVDGLAGGGTDPVVVMRAVKAGVGNKLPALQAVLVGQCVSAGGGRSDYCRLASLQVAFSEVENVATAATAAAPAVGPGGGGFGGSAQTAFGGNRSLSSVLGPIATTRTGDGQIAFSIPDIQNTFIGGTSLVVASVPGPVAGAGIPVLLAVAWLARHRRRAAARVGADPQS